MIHPPNPSADELTAWGCTQALAGAVCLPLLALGPVLTRFSRRVRHGIPHLLGQLPIPSCGPLIWLHGVSQGESMVAIGLGEHLKHRYPFCRLGFTTTHPEVLENARRKKHLDAVGFAPLDLLPFTMRAFRRWQPRLLIITETDFWPGLCALARRRGIPLALVNGRISEKLHRFHSRLLPLGRLIFRSFSLLAVQTETDRRRLIDMGAAPQAIQVLGNLKADLAPTSAPDAVRVIGSWKGTSPLVIFGSLHPVEFEALRPEFAKLLRNHDCRLLIAPRNTSLAREWQNSLSISGIPCCLRSQLTSTFAENERVHVIVLDTMGELGALYELGNLAFIGGSLSLTVGGHNPIESIRYRVPTLVGPHTRNFADLIGDLTAADAIGIGHTATEIAGAIDRFLQHPEDAVKMAVRASEVLATHQGAIARTLQALQPFLPHDH
ncbi:MAG TPA: glycosyltransferase N-terminal domain-containing protein [Candidatus Ozemobacteraceae bacterium]|nr:glycosyltransferase N-terminal domain-containing protein [Candidatus Ozemobacteraceae bacterium]